MHRNLRDGAGSQAAAGSVTVVRANNRIWRTQVRFTADSDAALSKRLCLQRWMHSDVFDPFPAVCVHQHEAGMVTTENEPK